MLDLDSLAHKCAQALNEREDLWREAVWSAAFQKLTQSMSDGEVEIFLTSCTSVSQLETVVRFLDEHPKRVNTSPYSILIQEAQDAGLGLADWIQSLSGNLGFRP